MPLRYILIIREKCSAYVIRELFENKTRDRACKQTRARRIGASQAVTINVRSVIFPIVSEFTRRVNLLTEFTVDAD